MTMIEPSALPTTRVGDETAAGRTVDVIHAHLRVALQRLAEKRLEIDLAWRYYDGDHPQLWMTDRLREVFGSAFQRGLEDNFCETAIDALVQRLEVTGWADPADTEGGLQTEEATALWEANDLDLDQEELYRMAGVAGEAFVIVWPGDAGDLEIMVNDARFVHVEYSSRRRSDRVWAAKVWHDGVAWRANLYYPDELVRLVSPPSKVSSGQPMTARRFAFDLDDPGELHDFAAVPVVRFATARTRRSRLAKLIPIQDKVNKLSANKMVAAEFLAFPQRAILSADPNLTSASLRAGAGAVWKLDPGGDIDGESVPATRIHEFAAADLANYDNSIEAEISKFFTIAPLPRHMIVNPGVAPSGAAIRADEGPFVHVARDCQQMFGGAWRDVMALAGVDVEAVWADPEVSNLETNAQAVLAFTQAGVPVEVAVRLVGWSDAEVDELVAAMDRTRLADQTAGGLLLQAADQGRNPLGMLP